MPLQVLARLLTKGVREPRDFQERKLGMHCLGLEGQQVCWKFAQSRLRDLRCVTVVDKLDIILAAPSVAHHTNTIPAIIGAEKSSTKRALHNRPLQVLRSLWVELFHSVVNALVGTLRIDAADVET